MTRDKQFIDQLSDSLFWDTDRYQIDLDENAAFLIVRIMERGTHHDVRSAWSFYGATRIKDALLAAPALSGKTIAFFANQFDLLPESFRAYQRNSNWAR